MRRSKCSTSSTKGGSRPGAPGPSGSPPKPSDGVPETKGGDPELPPSPPGPLSSSRLKSDGLKLGADYRAVGPSLYAYLVLCHGGGGVRLPRAGRRGSVRFAGGAGAVRRCGCGRGVRVQTGAPAAQAGASTQAAAAAARRGGRVRRRRDDVLRWTARGNRAPSRWASCRRCRLYMIAAAPRRRERRGVAVMLMMISVVDDPASSTACRGQLLRPSVD